jgi:hypothetical protein
MVKLDIVDLILSFGLESFAYELEFGFTNKQLHGVKDSSESWSLYEPWVALVFVLEEGLHKQSSELHISSYSNQAVMQHLFLLVVQYILGIQDRWCFELFHFLSGVLLKSLLSEDSLNFVIELDIVDLCLVSLQLVHLFK